MKRLLLPSVLTAAVVAAGFSLASSAFAGTSDAHNGTLVAAVHHQAFEPRPGDDVRYDGRPIVIEARGGFHSAHGGGHGGGAGGDWHGGGGHGGGDHGGGWGHGGDHGGSGWQGGDHSWDHDGRFGGHYWNPGWDLHVWYGPWFVIGPVYDYDPYGEVWMWVWTDDGYVQVEATWDAGAGLYWYLGPGNARIWIR